VQVSAKADYALGAVLVLAAHQSEFVNIRSMITQRAMPRKFLSSILGNLRTAGIVISRRGARGGYTLALPADQLTVGAVLRAINGPLTRHRNDRTYGSAGSTAGDIDDVSQTSSVIGAIMQRALDEVTVAQVLAERAGQLSSGSGSSVARVASHCNSPLSPTS